MKKDKSLKIGGISRRIFNSIRTRMMFVYMVSTILLSITSVFILITSGNLIEKMDDMFSVNVKLKNFMSQMDDVSKYLTHYLETNSSDSQLSYYREGENLRLMAGRLYDESRGMVSGSEDELLIKDIYYMVDSYFELTDMAVEEKRRNNAEEYIARFAEASMVSNYIKSYADRLNLSKVSVNTHQYSGMSEDLSWMSFTNIMLLISVIALNILVISNMMLKITRPIDKLAGSARLISQGNFDIEDIKVTTQDELSVMAEAFNGMKHSIREYIEALHDKAGTESQLLEQQIENLKIQSMLVDAEMKALQMQINPHFLFNTLNAGVQLAMLEGAERTSGFLEDISSMFRYNVKSLSRTVKIKDELDSVRAYGNLFHVRFGDIIKFCYNIDCSLLEIEVPPLIIQPLVENATIHGIGNLEQGGIITISLEQRENIAQITIEDNGVGMSEQTRQRILSCHNLENQKSGHTTGIGIANVIQRLRLFFGVHDILDIESQPGQGTKFILKIPCRPQSDNLQKETEDVQPDGI